MSEGPADTSSPRWQRVVDTLEGLSVGDSFGDAVDGDSIVQRRIPRGPWAYSDDTNMAMSVVWCLRKFGSINQDALAKSFAEKYDPSLGYGNSMNGYFRRVYEGEGWRHVAKSLFNYSGSYGNGAAMRVAPIGSYFAEDLRKVAEQAALSAEITHTHSEGIAGAVAVAVAAAVAYQTKQKEPQTQQKNLADEILGYVPTGDVRLNLSHAAVFPFTKGTEEAAFVLGNGSEVTAHDTVPFCIWCAGKFLNNFKEAMWQTASVGGDVDTNCAIVGAIIAAFGGKAAVPSIWIQNREPLPTWAFQD